MKTLYPLLLVFIGLLQVSSFAATEARKTAPKKAAAKTSSIKRPTSKAHAARTPGKAAAPKAAAKAAPKSRAKAGPRSRKTVRKRAYKAAPPVDPTDGDNVDGDDLTVRRAAAGALGTLNGAVVAVDPSNGRVLSIVNQKLALKSGFIPCSTIKLVTGLAALSEGVVERDENVRVGRYANFNLTTAIAHSNNQYFQRLGNQLGYERVTQYARMMGLGEKAGWEIAGEEPGAWPDRAPAAGGVGMMTAYGENILMTPLELAAMLSSIANGGKLFYLQYPRTPEEAEEFTPRLKRKLDLAPNAISDIKIGMRGAVDFGTARRAGYNSDQPILGKTGTCTDFRESNHMGWFGSFNEVDHHQLVIVVMLLGTKTVSGPVASGVAGEIYRKLSEERYFVADLNAKGATYSTACCSR